MVDTRKLKTFIKLADLTPSDTVTFANEGSLVEKDFSKGQDGSDVKTILEIQVSLNGEAPKKLTLNNTTINILKKVWGPDTATWVDKKAKCAVIETLAYGELKDVNVLKPIVGANPVPQESPEQEPPAQAAHVPQFDDDGNEIAWDE